MSKKSKRISGLSEGKIAQTPRKYFSDREKHLIIQEYLRGGSTKRYIWKKYTPSSIKPEF